MPIPQRFKVSQNAEFKEAHVNVVNALNQLPSNVNFVITSTKRSWGNTANKSGMHPAGKALDLRDDSDSLKFWYWLDTPEGLQWKNSNGVTILKEENHYHVEFNK